MLKRLLGIPRPVRGDLRRSSAPPPLLSESLLDLLPPRTRCLQILPRVALDLRLAVRAALDFVAEPLQLRRKLRTVHRRRVLLRLVKLLRPATSRVLPSAVSVTLKITACVCNCGAA